MRREEERARRAREVGHRGWHLDYSANQLTNEKDRRQPLRAQEAQNAFLLKCVSLYGCGALCVCMGGGVWVCLCLFVFVGIVDAYQAVQTSERRQPAVAGSNNTTKNTVR